MQYFKLYEDFSTPLTVSQLVNDLFKSRDLAHVSHLATDSFAVHKALEIYYDEIVELIDTFVETWQGTTGEKLHVELNVHNEPGDDQSWLKLLSQNIHMFSENLSSQFSHIKNILDEILHLIEQTLYRLKFSH